MRIYSDTLNWLAIRHAYDDVAHLCPQVYLEGSLVTTNGRRRSMTYDLHLEGHGARHTRWTNTGRHGAGEGIKAATWMDWGWIIAALFRHEPSAVIGQYDGREDFLTKTAREVVWRLQPRRGDTSVRTFATRYPLLWPNAFSETLRDGDTQTSPFALLNTLAPPRRLIPLTDHEALELWLEDSA